MQNKGKLESDIESRYPLYRQYNLDNFGDNISGVDVPAPVPFLWYGRAPAEPL